MARADIGVVDLLLEERNVVRQAEVVLLELVVTGLARHGEPIGRVVISQRTVSLDREDVVTGDAVVEDDAPQNLEVVGVLREIGRSDVRITLTSRYRTQQRQSDEGRGKDALELLHG